MACRNTGRYIQIFNMLLCSYCLYEHQRAMWYADSNIIRENQLFVQESSIPFRCLPNSFLLKSSSTGSVTLLMDPDLLGSLIDRHAAALVLYARQRALRRRCGTGCVCETCTASDLTRSASPGCTGQFAMVLSASIDRIAADKNTRTSRLNWCRCGLSLPKIPPGWMPGLPRPTWPNSPSNSAKRSSLICGVD